MKSIILHQQSDTKTKRQQPQTQSKLPPTPFAGKCNGCGETGHKKADCPHAKQPGDKDGTGGAVEDNDNQSSDAEAAGEAAYGYCLSVEKYSNEGIIAGLGDHRVFMMLDGGADQHCCTKEFAPGISVQPSDVRLRDIHHHKLDIAGSQVVPFAIAMEADKTTRHVDHSSC